MLTLVLSGSSLAGLRDWESADGRKIVAELVSYDAACGSLRIRRVDGSEYLLLRDKLSLADYAKRRDEELAAAAE